MNGRILNLNTLAEALVRTRVIVVHIVVTMDKECAKAALLTGGGLIACL